MNYDIKHRKCIKYTNYIWQNNYSICSVDDNYKLIFGIAHTTPICWQPLGYKFSWGMIFLTNEIKYDFHPIPNLHLSILRYFRTKNVFHHSLFLVCNLKILVCFTKLLFQIGFCIGTSILSTKKANLTFLFWTKLMYILNFPQQANHHLAAFQQKRMPQITRQQHANTTG